MARKSKVKFKMEGHTLPGINQKSETKNLKDGRSPSSAFQMQQPGESPLELEIPKWMKTAGRVGLGVATGGMSEGLLAAGKGIKNWMGGGQDDEDAEAGKELLKDEAKESMEGDSAIAMKSPMKDTGTKHFAEDKDILKKNKTWAKTTAAHDAAFGPGHAKHGRESYFERKSPTKKN